MPPDTYNKIPNNIPFSQGPNCRGSIRDKNEIIDKEAGKYEITFEVYPDRIGNFAMGTTIKIYQSIHKDIYSSFDSFVIEVVLITEIKNMPDSKKSTHVTYKGTKIEPLSDDNIYSWIDDAMNLFIIEDL